MAQHLKNLDQQGYRGSETIPVDFFFYSFQKYILLPKNALVGAEKEHILWECLRVFKELVR
jgi:hypothetical protein